MLLQYSQFLHNIYFINSDRISINAHHSKYDVICDSIAISQKQHIIILAPLTRWQIVHKTLFPVNEKTVCSKSTAKKASGLTSRTNCQQGNEV